MTHDDHQPIPPRVEDRALLTGIERYVADLDLPGALHVRYVTSMMAHARITGIKVDEARVAPGVLDVVTGADVDVDVGPYPPIDPRLPAPMHRPLLATDTVRFVGEAVVAIVAETASAAADAAELVIIDYEPLDPLVDIESSLRADRLLFPDVGSNVAVHADFGDDVDPHACEVSVRATFRSARVAACPLETRAGASRWEPDGRLVHWSSCQGAHPAQALLCAVYDLPPDRVRVIVPTVGGSFGAKARPYPEEVLLPLLARRVGRPVRWVPDRSDDMVGLGHSRAQVQHVELGGRSDGTLEAMRLHIVGDAGAYPMVGAILPRNTGALSPGPYRIPRVRWSADAVVTTTTPTAAYRGAGRPEAAAIMERAVDLFAAEIGMDPVELRRVNLIRPEEFPYRSATGLEYDSGDYQRCLDQVLESVGYEQLRAEQAGRRAAGGPLQLGVGVATFVDRTAGIPGDTEYGSTELRPDGSVLVRTGSTPYGQGHRTTWAMLVAERTGLPLERIEVVHGDTDLVPRSGVTGGSRSVQRAGSAVAAATDDLVARARDVAAHLLEAALDDVVIDVGAGGRFHVAGTPARTVGWEEVAGVSDADPLRCEADVGGEATFPFGAYVAVVEVDTETGKIVLRRLVTVDDAGRIVNPVIALGQVHGGAAQGVAQALYEVFVYDEDGTPMTTNLADYAMPSAAELPSLESRLVETPTPNNALGAKGIAESGTIGAPPAIQNAVVDALAHLGVTHLDLPCTPERVWRAVAEARGDAPRLPGSVRTPASGTGTGT